MKALFYPGIWLMNRLGFALKFSLISVLFFVPLLGANLYLVRDAYHEWRITDVLLGSMGRVQQTLHLQQTLDVLTDLTLIRARVGQVEQKSDIRQRMESTQTAAAALMAGLNQAGANTAAIQQKLDALASALNTVSHTDGAGPKAELASQLAAHCALFLEAVMEQQGLSQDNEQRVRQLSTLVSVQVPRLTALLNKARALGSVTLGVGYLSSSDTVVLEQVVVGMERARTESAQTFEVFDAAQGNTLMQALQDSLKAVDAASKVLDEQILNGADSGRPWPVYFDQMTGFSDQVYALNDEALTLLVRSLNQRLSQAHGQMVLLSVASLVILLLITYLYGAFYLATRGVIEDLGRVMGKVADGDMTASFEVVGQDELAALGRVFNGTVGQIQNLIRQVDGVVLQVGRQTDLVQSVATTSSKEVTDQREQLELVASAMNQLSTTARQVARNASAAVNSAQDVNRETERGRHRVREQVSAIQKLAGEINNSMQLIHQLATDSQSIGQVLEVIRSIAEQTNLLALNAAIEAARAGDQGRGFAVVADEVRTLARRTQQSTHEIEHMIAGLHSRVADTVKAMSNSHQIANTTVSQADEVEQALENIVAASGLIVEQSQQIAVAAEQQTQVSQSIDRSLVDINRAGERTASGAVKSEQASQDLQGLVSTLQTVIGAFRI
jgi:methyl-accepting chemotaxis protein